MAKYNIDIEGTKFKCDDDQYILDAAEEAGMDLPYACRAGSCAECMCVATTGRVDQRDGSYLTDDMQKMGLVSICVAKPQSDLTMKKAPDILKQMDESINENDDIDSTAAAVWKYMNGKGKPANIGPNTKQQFKDAARNKAALANLKAGTTDPNGYYRVDFTSSTFHIGQTGVRYTTTCQGGYCTTTFTGFVQWNQQTGQYYPDSFSDPINLGIELPGGTPYDYVPYNWTETYPNPGY